MACHWLTQRFEGLMPAVKICYEFLAVKWFFKNLFWGGKGEYVGEEKRGKTAWAGLKTVWTSSDIHCCLHNGKAEPKCQIPKLCEVQSLDPSISAWILSGSQEPKCRYHILKCMKMNDSK